MNLELFIRVAKLIKLPAGNYMFLSKKTKKLIWFMVAMNYDKTLRMVYTPKSRDYESMIVARQLHRACDKELWHKRITHTMKKLRRK